MALTTAAMATEIETALEAAFPLPPGADAAPRRKLAVAIAKGILTHLNKNQSSFTVQVPSGTPTTSKTVSIEIQP